MLKIQNILIRKYLSIFIFSGVFFLLSPSFSFAQNITLRTAKKTYAVGDTFVVDAVLNASGYSINSVEGELQIPTTSLTLLEIRSGNSILPLWVKRPQMSNDGSSISFSGGVPGGYSGSDGALFSFVLKAKAEGKAAIEGGAATALLNDGKGSVVPKFSVVPLTIQIQKA